MQWCSFEDLPNIRGARRGWSCRPAGAAGTTGRRRPPLPRGSDRCAPHGSAPGRPAASRRAGLDPSDRSQRLRSPADRGFAVYHRVRLISDLRDECGRWQVEANHGALNRGRLQPHGGKRRPPLALHSRIGVKSVDSASRFQYCTYPIDAVMPSKTEFGVPVRWQLTTRIPSLAFE